MPVISSSALQGEGAENILFENDFLAELFVSIDDVRALISSAAILSFLP
jgi:hypothetical protein